MCDMIFEKYECDIASYADDNTPHTDLYTVLSKLKNCTDSLFKWFKENHMKPNGDKCHFLVTTEKSVSINIDGSNVENKTEQKLLSIKFDSSLSFKALVTEFFKVKNDLATDIMKDVFELKEPPYKLRSESNHFGGRNVKTTYYGFS